MMKFADNADLLNALCEFIQAFGGTLINIKRYPEGSTIVTMALDRCRQNSDLIFQQVESFTLTESERRILVDNEPLGEKIQDRAYMRTFVDSMIARGIRSITFRREMSPAELLAFLKVMGEKPEELRRRGPLDQQLQGANVENIVLDEKVFVALIKGQTVADIADLEKLEALGKGQLDPSQVKDGLFLSYLLSKIPVQSLNVSEERIEELKEKIGYATAKNADDLDFAHIGSAIAQSLEEWTGADKVPEAGTPESESKESRRAQRYANEQVEKIVSSFEEISNSILNFKQPAVRAKLLNDFLRVVLGFKELTLAKVLSSRLAASEDIDLKAQILQNLSHKKRSAVIDHLLQRYQRVFDGLRGEDFAIDPAEVSESEDALKKIFVLAKRADRADLAEKAQRAIGLARVITKETASPGGILILKMKRLFSRPPAFLTADDFLDDFGEFAKILCDSNRVDLVRKVLERVASNFAAEDQAARLATVQAFVRINQDLLDLRRTDLVGDVYLLLSKQMKMEKEMVVFARILASIVADFQKVMSEGDYALAHNILRLLGRSRDEAEGVAARQIFDQAIAKLTAANLMTDAMFDAMESEDERESETAIRLLMSFPAADVINRVLTRLSASEDRRVRKKCLSFVTRYGENAREIVTARIRPEHPWYFNRNLLTLLGDIGDETSVAAITPFLRHEDDRLRKAAIGTLTRIGGPEVGRVLAEAFDDQPVEVQATLVSLLAKEKTPHAVPKFVARLKDKAFADTNEALAIAMIHALGEIGDRSAAETLQGFLKRGGLMGMFAKQNDAIVAACISALGRLGDASTKDQIRRFAHHSNPDVAKAAQQSIRLLEDQAG